MSKRLFASSLIVASSLLLSAIPARAYTPVSELKDLTPDHWAYNAIKLLVEKYQLMDGFSDGTFKGTRTVSRYELAAILAKLMARVEEMAQAASEPREPVRAAPAVSPDDLRTIARLQQEFKDELTALKQRVDTQDSRLGALEKRMRLGGSLEGFYRSYPTQPDRLAAASTEEVELRTSLNLDAAISPELSYRGTLVLFNNGLQRLANGHQLTETPAIYADVGNPLYVRRSLFSWTPSQFAVHVGVMTLSDTLRVGSSLRNEFRSGPLWPDGQGGYGFVGTPPLQPSSGLVAVPARGSFAQPIPTGRVRWNAGVNVVEDLLDPNSAYGINSGAAPCAVVSGNYGPVEAGLGLNYGTPGADPLRALIEQPASYPLIAPYGDGYTLGKLGLDLGWMRWGVYGRSDNAVLAQMSLAAKGRGWGTALDFGDDGLGLSLGHAEFSRRDYDLTQYDESSLFVTSSNFLAPGWQFGVGTKLGNMPLAAGPYALFNWVSTGAYLRVPGISIVPSVLIAFQTSGNGLFTAEYGSGFTAIAELQPTPALPSLMVEYSQGHFYGTPLTPLPGGYTGTVATANQLVGGAVQTHEQLVLGTSIKF